MSRTCTNCPHSLDQHMTAEEGYTRPCQKFGCNCGCFSDAQANEAAKEKFVPKGKGPAGYVR